VNNEKHSKTQQINSKITLTMQ